MKKEDEGFDLEKFLDSKRKSAEHRTLEEISRASVKNAIMRNYKRAYIKEYYLSDFIMNGDKVILKWERNYPPLSEQELDKIYNPE